MSDEERFKKFLDRFGLSMILMEAGPELRTFEIDRNSNFSEYNAVLKIFFNGAGKFGGMEVQGD